MTDEQDPRDGSQVVSDSAKNLAEKWTGQPSDAERTKPGRCMVCREPVEVPEWVIDMAREFNHQLVKVGTPKDQIMTLSNIITCERCGPIYEEELKRRDREDRALTDRLLADARAGKPLMGEDVKWLVKVGEGDRLQAILRKQGKVSNRREP